ncbi:hypothetical protein [Nocardioides sp. W7]|uniref:hypothetical protein n=1 Tax=Nocardioides sp. W7 TaxID=2931390 RepID=UPI001FD459DE|nr:hypothetical protein [Nocardioides sp. W7]
MSTPASAGPRRAWGWHAHLRAGGTTAWGAWTEEAEPAGRYLPGAQQLELLRRLNEAGRPTAGLAARVLVASAPGRGRPDLELAGAAAPRRYGAQPVDPTELPDEELVRVASSLLAEDAVAAGVPARPAPARSRPWRTRYRLVGDPWLTEPIRTELAARGRPSGDRGAPVLVLGTDLASLIVDVWTARSFSTGAPSWSEWIAGIAERRRPPRRADLVRTARRWADEVGRDRVRVVLDPAALPRLVGVRRGALPVPPPVSADATDLARRVGAVLGVLVAPERRVELLREGLLPRLAALPGPALTIPAGLAPWVQEHAGRMREDLQVDGYAVVGDPDVLLPRPRAGVEGPRDDAVLALALRLLLENENGRPG